MRIVSLLPSATDIVCSLGLGEQLVGRTHECDWPPGVEEVPVMTADTLDTASMRSREIHEAVGASVHSGSSIYALDVAALEEAKPDLVLTQELCEVCAVSYREVAAAARMIDADVRVVSLEPRGVDDILEHVLLVGRLTGTSDVAGGIVSDSRARLARLPSGEHRIACVEWLDPVFAAGHWVPEQVRHAGGAEVCGREREPSREIAFGDVVAAEPEVVVLMPCGMAIERTLSEVDERWLVFPSVWAVDGSSYFNRPGPRVIRGAEILAAIIHGDGRGLSAGEAVRVHQR